MRFSLGLLVKELEAKLDADVMSISGALRPGVDNRVRDAAEASEEHRDSVAVILHTTGGVVEIVERIATVIRHHWSDVSFIVPDYALSAGTVLAMSGDRIYMDYFSILGPIDPQVEREGKLVPALSYLTQYNRIMEKFANGTGTTADLALLNQMDLAELHSFEEAKKLSVELLEKWLSTYKFKDWVQTATQKMVVTDAMKETRAQEIASALANHERWHSHGRGISRETLRAELNLRIDDLETDPDVHRLARDYSRLLQDMLLRENVSSFVHTRSYW
jgi:ClpP class serine protease